MTGSIDIAKISDWKKFLKEVKEANGEYVVKEGDEPLAAVISPASYAQWVKTRREAREEFFRIVEAVQERTKTEKPEDIESLIEEAIGETRK